MKDSLGVGLDLVSDLAQHPAFASEEIERQRQQIAVGPEGQLRRSGVSRQRRVRSAGLRLPSVRPAAVRHARLDRRDHARRSAGVSQELVRRQQRDPRDRRRRHGGRSLRRRRARVRLVGKRAGSGRRRSRPIRRRRRAASSSSISRARCRPRSASATSRIPRKHPDFMALDLATKILGGEGATACIACCAPSAA